MISSQMSNHASTVSKQTSFVEDDDWCQFADVTETLEGDGADVFGEADTTLLRDHQRDQAEHQQSWQLPNSYSGPCNPSTSLRSSFLASNHGSTPSITENATSIVPAFRFEMPPQLHPAVSLGVRRVSSCYLSLHSQESVADLLSQLGEGSSNNDSIRNGNSDRKIHSKGEEAFKGGRASAKTEFYGDLCYATGSSDLLYHDILMQVFTFLDAPSLAAFSETARRPNFEVFYFLQLQLQQALLIEEMNEEEDSGSTNSAGDEGAVGGVSSADGHETDPVGEGRDAVLVQQQRYDVSRATIAGCASLSRLAGLNLAQAQELVKEYLESNSTLRIMPLSHSLAYARHFLQRHGFNKGFPASENKTTSAQTLASAALFMTVVGAASIMSTVGGADAAASMASLSDSFGGELPNVLFRVGFLGSLMGAARQMSDTEQRAAIRERAEQMARSAEQMARSMQERMMLRGIHVDDDTLRESNQQHDQRQQSLVSSSGGNGNFRLPSLFEMKIMLQETMFAARRSHDRQPVLSNPYDHLPLNQRESDGEDYEKEGEEKKLEFIPTKAPPQRKHSIEDSSGRKMPSGCVGAYSRAIHKANIQITKTVKESRRANFLDMSPVDQRQLSVDFLSACSSNDSLDRVKEMITSIDVDGSFVGSDGSETCPLHTAAFHGAEKVVDFLCTGIDDQDPRRDGGLCEVNSSDSNGWTALHFAAGANSVVVVHVLVKHGAKLKVEAHNGYTPLQWAVRLSNEQVAEELTNILSSSGADRGVWMSSQPLTSIANRFFSLIPTH